MSKTRQRELLNGLRDGGRLARSLETLARAPLRVQLDFARLYANLHKAVAPEPSEVDLVLAAAAFVWRVKRRMENRVRTARFRVAARKGQLPPPWRMPLQRPGGLVTVTIWVRPGRPAATHTKLLETRAETLGARASRPLLRSTTSGKAGSTADGVERAGGTPALPGFPDKLFAGSGPDDFGSPGEPQLDLPFEARSFLNARRPNRRPFYVAVTIRRKGRRPWQASDGPRHSATSSPTPDAVPPSGPDATFDRNQALPGESGAETEKCNRNFEKCNRNSCDNVTVQFVKPGKNAWQAGMSKFMNSVRSYVRRLTGKP
ncbi:MAG TPA: hypothetical protein VMT20_23090 [Terriglobia bacterium]|nr:hypothetical protein [Terriglobia bacterium]